MTIRSVVGFFAHPDDETMLVGGMGAMLAQQGIRVTFVSATRGEGGELGEPPITTREALGQTRETELREAGKALGVQIEFMDYIDPVCEVGGELFPFACSPDDLARQAGEIAVRLEADVVLTHGIDGEYGHPAHILLHHQVIRGVQTYKPNTLIYTVAARVPTIEDFLWNAHELAHFALNIQPWADAKISAMECHLTQSAVFRRKNNLPAVKDAMRVVESVRRYHPETDVDQVPDDPFAQLLIAAGAWSPAPSE